VAVTVTEPERLARVFGAAARRSEILERGVCDLGAELHHGVVAEGDDQARRHVVPPGP
jgi:hypothetical protein